MHLAHLVLVITVLVGVAAPPLDPAPDVPPPVVYRAPVDAPVADGFRAPPTPFGPGNRGIEYATAPGTAVRSAAAGAVVFAGPVAGSLHVTILHADGLRTSYSFLASVAVATGQAVEGGTVLGVTTGHLHFGVRSGDEYLDPQLILSGRAVTRVHLVPHEVGGGAPPTDRGAEVAALLAVVTGRTASVDPRDPVATAGSVLAATPGFVPPVDDALAHLRLERTPRPTALRVVGAAGRWLARSRDCTPAGASVPPVAGRRILVLVGDSGSSSASAGVDRVDTSALGYARADVVRFSYAGGRTPGTGNAFPGVAEHRSSAGDTEGDLVAAGERLAALVGDLAAAAPGIPVDVVAHSQGGVVARVALVALDAEGLLARPGTPDAGDVALGVVTTLATPHQGTDLATAVDALAATDGGAHALDALEAAGLLPGDPDAAATTQLSETGDLVADLGRWGIPPGVHLLSIAARVDLVVASSHTVVAGADHAVVPLTGPSAHDELPGAAATTREIGLALAGLPPGCQRLAEAITDAVAAEVITAAEDDAALAAVVAAAGLGGVDPGE